MKTHNGKPSILIIDDVTSNLVLLADIIREAGYIPRPVTSVRQAKQALSVEHPSIILLDVTMPEIDGYEYCTMLKNDVKTRDIPVIFISALNSAKDRVRGFDCGAVDFISKPFERAEVLVRVNTHLKMHQIQRELEIYNKKLHMIVNQQFYKITEERKNIIFALARLAEAREDRSGRHLENIAKNSRLLSMSLQFTRKYEKIVTNEFVETIEIASQLHDIGKAVISDLILLKSGNLTDEEIAVMRTHTQIGADTLRDLYSANENNEFLEMAIDITQNHHERWDGGGYPAGLAGDKIPLSARIVAVADVYDALVSKRCYKKAIKHEDAMKIINDESGKSFDPDVVDILNKVQRHMKRTEQDEKDIASGADECRLDYRR